MGSHKYFKWIQNKINWKGSSEKTGCYMLFIYISEIFLFHDIATGPFDYAIPPMAIIILLTRISRYSLLFYFTLWLFSPMTISTSLGVLVAVISISLDA